MKIIQLITGPGERRKRNHYTPTTFFLVMILISPPIPSPSYLAEGVVITSIFEMTAPGNPLNTSLMFLANIEVSLPLRSTLKLDFPFTFILSSPSTVTKGVFRSMSMAVSVLLVGSSSTLKTIYHPTVPHRLCELTTTSFSMPVALDNCTGSICISPGLLLYFNSDLFFSKAGMREAEHIIFLYPVYSTESCHFPLIKLFAKEPCCFF